MTVINDIRLAKLLISLKTIRTQLEVLIESRAEKREMRPIFAIIAKNMKRYDKFMAKAFELLDQQNNRQLLPELGIQLKAVIGEMSRLIELYLFASNSMETNCDRNYGSLRTEESQKRLNIQ